MKTKNSKETHNSKRLILVLCSIFASILLTFICVNISIQGLCESNIYFYLAAGNTISGTIISHYREADKFFIVVSTQKFGEVDIECSIDQYKNLSNSSTINVCIDLILSEE